MNNNEVTMDSEDCENGAVQDLTCQKPACPNKRQDWTEFKGRIFKVASTVILPKNKRVCTRVGSMKTKTPSTSVKSLPQYKQEKSWAKTYRRSNSEQPQPTIQLEDCSPEHRSRTITFGPTHFPITEDEEEVDSSSASSTTGNLSDGGKKQEDRSFTPAGARSCDRTSEIQNVPETSMNVPGDLKTRCTPRMRREFLPSATKTNVYEKNKLLITREKSSRDDDDDDNDDDKDDDAKWMEETEEYSDDDSLLYHNFYNCVPPPIFMLSITIAEVAFFIYHAKRMVNDPKYGFINKFSPAPLDSKLIYDPTRRYEIWRYLTYALVHSGYMHIINNVVVQLVLGILLEMVHKWWRVLAIYFAGVLAGSLATSIAEPYNFLAGASAGVYALIAAHLSTVILNWSEMEYPWIRVLVFAAFVLHDGGTALYYSYIVGEKTNVGYAAHLGGAVAGLLVGIHVLKNLQWREWEKVLWWLCVLICLVLLVFAVVWNIVRTDLFP